VSYPTLIALTRSLRAGLPTSKTRFAETTAVPAGSVVSTGVDESWGGSLEHQKSPISGDVSSE